MHTTTDTPSARQRILATAQRLFYRDGIRATGIDRLIAESSVTKATFYRHFPGKNELIVAYLQERQQAWLAWFGAELARDGTADLPAQLLAACQAWFVREDFRGCALLNAVAELGDSLPEAAQLARAQREALAATIAARLPPSAPREARALAVAVALDGAILRAQLEGSIEHALPALDSILRALLAGLDQP